MLQKHTVPSCAGHKDLLQSRSVSAPSHSAVHHAMMQELLFGLLDGNLTAGLLEKVATQAKPGPCLLLTALFLNAELNER